VQDVAKDPLAIGCVALRIEDVHVPEFVHRFVRHDRSVGIFGGQLEEFPISRLSAPRCRCRSFALILSKSSSSMAAHIAATFFSRSCMVLPLSGEERTLGAGTAGIPHVRRGRSRRLAGARLNRPIEENPHIAGGYRSAEEIALHFVAALLTQKIDLLLRLCGYGPARSRRSRSARHYGFQGDGE
jgi:hypothetical protein